MINKYTVEHRLRVSAMLKDNDDVRTAFNAETLLLEDKVNKFCTNRATNAFIVGMILTALCFSVVLVYMEKNRDSNIMDTIELAIKGNK